MPIRSIRLLVAAMLLLAACSGDPDVPEGQEIKPASAPSGWTATDLGDLTIATPTEWGGSETKPLTDTMDVTTWRSELADGRAPTGASVRVISSPQQKAKKAAMSLAVSAMAQLQGGKPDPHEIRWPGAETAFYLAYVSTLGPPDDSARYVTRMFVLDLANGHQLQVTALARTGQDASIPDTVLSTVDLD